jgi:hypothetical protein
MSEEGDGYREVRWAQRGAGRIGGTRSVSKFFPVFESVTGGV